MDATIEFKAPWSAGLRRLSIYSISILVAVVLAAIVARQYSPAPAILAAIALPILILIAAAACMVKGYVLTNDEIVVKRLGWSTRFELQGLRSVSGDNEAMQGSLRLFGNGGLLSYSGYFWNRKIGRYRAFATDPSRAVVMRYADRTVVITPDDPQRFIVRARTMLKNREA
jgi:hypothetical protein